MSSKYKRLAYKKIRYKMSYNNNNYRREYRGGDGGGGGSYRYNNNNQRNNNNNNYGRGGYNNNNSQQDRINVQLFIGNIPSQCLGGEVREFLNAAARQGGLKIAPHLPGEAVNSVRIGNRFAFAEFASRDECTLGLNLNGIKFKGHCLNVSRPKKYRGPTDQSVSWHDWITDKMRDQPDLRNTVVGLTTDEEHEQFIAAERANKTYAPGYVHNNNNNNSSYNNNGQYNNNSNNYNNNNRGGNYVGRPPADNYRLYVGNCPKGIPNDSLQLFFSQAMTKAKLTTAPGNPITQCNVTNKNFAFITFRTVEEACNALNMNGIPFMGKELSLGRPKGYVGPQNEKFATWKTLLQTHFDLKKAKLFAHSTNTLKMKHHTFVDMIQVPTGVKVGLTAGPPSKFIEFSNLKGVKELKAGIEEECKRFGTVSTIDVNESDGVARVEFASLYDAACALLGTHGRTLDGNVVNVKYVY